MGSLLGCCVARGERVQVLALAGVEIGQQQAEHVEGAAQSAAPALSGSSARRGSRTYSKLSQ